MVWLRAIAGISMTSSATLVARAWTLAGARSAESPVRALSARTAMSARALSARRRASRTFSTAKSVAPTAAKNGVVSTVFLKSSMTGMCFSFVVVRKFMEFVGSAGFRRSASLPWCVLDVGLVDVEERLLLPRREYGVGGDGVA